MKRKRESFGEAFNHPVSVIASTGGYGCSFIAGLAWWAEGCGISEYAGERILMTGACMKGREIWGIAIAAERK